MGYNTTIMVCNDELHQIAEDPNFGRDVARASERAAVLGGQPVGIGMTNAYVIETHHADYEVLVKVGGNTGENITSTLRDDFFKPKLSKSEVVASLRKLTDTIGSALSAGNTSQALRQAIEMLEKKD